MSKRQAIEAALAAWREAERRVAGAIDGEHSRLTLEVQMRRDHFKRLSSDYMMERMGALHEAESRRQAATPSTPAFHVAAKDEKDIAADIWDEARRSDEETPQTRLPVQDGFPLDS